MLCGLTLISELLKLRRENGKAVMILGLQQQPPSKTESSAETMISRFPLAPVLEQRIPLDSHMPRRLTILFSVVHYFMPLMLKRHFLRHILSAKTQFLCKKTHLQLDSL